MKRTINSRGFSHHFILPILAILAVVTIGFITLHISNAASKSYTVTRCKAIGIIRTGSKGNCVRVLQQSLNNWAGTEKIEVSGTFDKSTRGAVRSFQRAKHLTIDGIVGPITWGALKPYSVSYTPSTPITPPTTLSVPKARGSTVLTVASWNVLWKNNTPTDVKKGIQTILSSAEVVGLQEVGTNNTTAIRNAVGNLDSSKIGVYQPGGSTPIAWNATVYKKIKSGYKRLDNYGVVKYVTYVKLQNKTNDQQFYLFNFHAVVGTPDTPSEDCNTKECKAYKAEMKALSSLVASHKSDNVPIFVTGDYNANYRFDKACTLSWYPCQTFRAIGLRSGYSFTSDAGIDSTSSSIGTGSKVIDYVFSWKRSDVTPVSMQIVAPNAACHKDSSGQTHCWNNSDHKPVLFTVKISPTNPTINAT